MLKVERYLIEGISTNALSLSTLSNLNHAFSELNNLIGIIITNTFQYISGNY